MKLTNITVYQVDLPFEQGIYKLSSGRTWNSLDSTVIRLTTDEGLIGWGETCPFGSNYDPAFAKGVRAGIAELALNLLGVDFFAPGEFYNLMDRLLVGHGYIKHGLDMACWDLFGKRAQLPLCDLFGGRLQSRVAAAGGVSLDDELVQEKQICEYRKSGIRQFSTKATGDPGIDIANVIRLAKKLRNDETIKIDANGGWRVDEAIRVMNATGDYPIYFEQPCSSYEECFRVRTTCARPIILDESVTDLSVVVNALKDGICDAVNLKLSRVGGLTRALTIRDVCSAFNIPMYIQCSGGSSITQAAIVHLAQSTPDDHLLYIWDLQDLINFPTAERPILNVDGYMTSSDEPGLGITPKLEVLGSPVATYS